ncbi:uncharacterized protein EAE98_010576 [Botrytis deweyae]|uniref:NADH dehydrogenase [ubiquinone] 1 alpha subcomplex subunit 1 n=1 Tax=Botrytis deweyae TaxID=2478750 RepID=A0ABQ7I837_9HELO|nr:uncharacterized protein EAE98_010576 [Botrytis deweyae]KAF7916479.1 hypothetical protein EAE99_009661 [Botrytis elliptica]KAF7916567.1 hypothetical protein EAE98_010576 [Botrytis deweyae]
MILDNTLAIVFGIASIIIPTITAIILSHRSSTHNTSHDLEQHVYQPPREYMVMEEFHSIRRWHAQR